MLFIIGTSHVYQFGAGACFGRETCTEANQNSFAHMLRESIASSSAEVLAEELNLQALQEVGKSVSVAQLVANELAIRHMFCEPNRVERVALEIQSENDIRTAAFPKTLHEAVVQERVAQSWRRREEEWVRRLGAVKSENVLFVCGASHIATFASLTQEHGIVCKVLHDDWKA